MEKFCDEEDEKEMKENDEGDESLDEELQDELYGDAVDEEEENEGKFKITKK